MGYKYYIQYVKNASFKIDGDTIVYKRQTYQNLSTKYNHSIKWVQYKIKEYEVEEKVHNRTSHHIWTKSDKEF